MRYQLKKKEYKIGHLKSFWKFAWFPKKVQEHIVWLEYYHSMCEMVEEHNVIGKKGSHWREYDRRLVDKLC